MTKAADGTLEAAANVFETGLVASSTSLRALPANAEETLSEMSAGTMIYQHAMALFNASYDKLLNKFAMSSEDAFACSTMFFCKAFSQDLVLRRFDDVALKYELPNLYLELGSVSENVGVTTEFA